MTTTKTRCLVRRGLLVLVMVPVLLFTARLVRADASKRDQLESEIERLLSDIASELRDVPGDSSVSDLERTLDYAGKVHDKARDLRDHAADDSGARRMADAYPDIARRYQDAARYLRELKLEHRKLDEHPRKCEDAMKLLASRLRGYTDSHDPRGIEEVPKLARELGRIGKAAVDQAEAIRRAAYERYDRVDDFSDSEGKWSDVRSYLQAAGRTMYAHAVAGHDQIKRDDMCGNLAKEERNPLVEHAMRTLFEGKKGIELLYTKMDRQLAELASTLDGLAGDSDDSDVRSAEGKLGELERQLEQLDRSKGNDGEAKRRVESWRALLRTAREALGQLRTLKQGQFLSDRAPQKCREATDKLRDLVRGYLGTQETAGLTEIPLYARGLGAPIRAGLGKTDEHHAVMARARADAQRFDASEGRWLDVKDKLHGSATMIFEHWKKAREAAHTACDELAKGDQNPEIVRAVASLRAAQAKGLSELRVLEADHRRWYDALKELRTWYKEDTKNVRDMFCNLPESPGDSTEGDAYAAQLTQIANRMRDRLQPKSQELQAEARRLRAVAQTLLKLHDKANKEGAERVDTAVRKTMAGVQNLLDDELKGSNDPEFRAMLETGKSEHKRIQADSSKCTASELTFGSRRVDCIRVDGNTCYVVEIKPNNKAAQDRGREQIDDGIDNVERLLKDKKFKGDLTGNLEIFRACFDTAKLKAKLERELRVYEYCPPDGVLYKDFVVP